MKKIKVTLEAPSKGINQLTSSYTLDEKEAKSLINVDLDSRAGTISTRDLLQLLEPGAITSGSEVIAIHFYEQTDGTFYLIATDGINVYASLSGTGAWSHINNGKVMTASKPIPKFLNVEGKLWVTNGYDKVAQWDGATYRYLDAALTAGTGTISSAAAVVTGVGTSFTTEVAVGNNIKANGETRMVTIVTDNTHLTVDSAPAVAWAGNTFQIQKTPNVPIGEFFAYDKSKVIMAKISGSPLSVRMSIVVYAGVFIKADDAQAWPATEELIAPAAYGAGLTGLALIKGLVTQQGISQGRILLFKDSSMYTLLGTTISDFRFDLLSSSIGTRYSKTIEYLEDGSVSFAGELGLYRTNGEEVTRFSDKVELSYLQISRIHTEALSFTFSQNFNGFTLTNTEVSENKVQLSGSNLTGTAESANTQLTTLTVKAFLESRIQSFADGSTVLVQIKTATTSIGLAAAVYSTLTDGEIPLAALNLWCKVKITLTRATTATNPAVTFVQLNYEAYQALVREPFLVYDSDELLFGMDTEYENIRLSLNRFGAWTIDKEVDLFIGCGNRYRGVKYLGASNGKVYSIYAPLGDDDTVDIDSEWTTKPITAGYPDKLKSLDSILIFSEGTPFRRLFLDLTIDGVLRRTLEFTVSENTLRETKLWMPQGINFKTLELTFRTAARQQISMIGRIDLNIRLLEGEEAN